MYVTFVSLRMFLGEKIDCTILSGIPLADLGGCTSPPMGPNSFVFAYIFTEKHPHRRSTPLTGARPLWEILDPPLYTILENVSIVLSRSSSIILHVVPHNPQTQPIRVQLLKSKVQIYKPYDYTCFPTMLSL